MEKPEHGKRLAVAMGAKDYRRTVVADYMNVKVRTVTNWTSGSTMPTEAERARLRQLLGPYDADGDPVEVALRASALDGFRQTKVIGYYQEQLHQQRLEQGA